MKLRVDKFIANNFNISRRQTLFFLRTNELKINNQIVRSNKFVFDPKKDEIKLNDEIYKYQEFIYLALNKPKDYLSANKDFRIKTVLDLIEYDVPYRSSLSIIGRLDKDAFGLIILTNDNDLVHSIKSPKKEIEKEYEIILENKLSLEDLARLNEDIYLDNKLLKKFKIYNIENTKLKIILKEGKYHQIKRIFALVNNKVISLKRIRINKLELDKLNLKESEYIEILKTDIV